MKVHTITERELLIGVMNAICRIEERITGKPASVRIDLPDGVDFLSPSAMAESDSAEVTLRRGGSSECCCEHSSRHALLRDSG